MSEDRMTLRYASVVPVFETGEERLMKFDLTGARKDGSNPDRGLYREGVDPLPPPPPARAFDF